MNHKGLQEVINQFAIVSGDYIFHSLGKGLLHDTFLAKGQHQDYVLQRLNTEVFTKPENIMLNIETARPFLDAPGYTHIKFLPIKSGNSMLAHDQLGIWRLMHYIENSETFSKPVNPAMAFEVGGILGRFHQLLEKANPNDFISILPNFHDPAYRWEQYKTAREKATDDRRKNADAVANLAQTVSSYLQKNVAELRVRVSHNDTKMDNILFDKRSGLALGLIDLDTLMPGYFHVDFGDAVREVAFIREEKESVVPQVKFLPDYFQAMIKGVFSSGVELSEDEINALPLGAVKMPFLHGVRALTDYLEGNRYYKVQYEDENLHRARELLSQANTAINFCPKMSSIIAAEAGSAM